MSKKIISFYVPFILTMALLLCFLIYVGQTGKILISSVECFVFYSFLFVFRKKTTRSLVWALFMLVLGAQMASLYTSGDFIIPLTLSNAGEFNAIGLTLLLKLAGIVFCFVFMSWFFYQKFNSGDDKGHTYYVCALLIFLPLINGPFFIFGTALYSYYKQLTFSPSYNYPEIAKKYFKVGVWREPSNFVNVKKPNVIVLFTEGMSSSVIDSDNEKGLQLTPNIDMLLNDSLVFQNYFNHTAATFRGLRGQLTSAYQYKDGIGANQDGFFEISNENVKATFDKRLISLPEILEKYGYKTIFLSSTEKNSTLNAMLKTMSFNEVYGMGDFDYYQNDRMTDKQVFSSLEKLIEKNKDKSFFIGVYTSGTHHGMDSPDLRYKDGKNPYYNKFYNYDAQLGFFINYLKRNELMKNTILIVTADHSTFPTPDFNNSFGTNAKYFVDRIPLIINGAGVTGKVIDVAGRNSLALTPTILNLLNINNEPNFFLGCSLFDEKCNKGFSTTSAIGGTFYVTSPEKFPKYSVQELKSSEDILEFYNVSG